MAADAIRKITVRGFKSIASLELQPSPINIIIGANGSGKSNVLEVFRLLRTARCSKLNDYVRAAGGAERLLHFGSEVTERIEIDLDFNFTGDLAPTGYELTLKPTADDELFAAAESISLAYSSGPISLAEWQKKGETGIGNEDSEVLTQWVRRVLDSWRVYHFANVAPLRRMAPSHENRFLLLPDGDNLAGVLYRLPVAGFEDSYRQIVRAVQQVAPFFGNFEFPERQESEPQFIQLQWRHKNSDQYFGASSLSDGTLRFIALATLLLQPDNRQSVILIDEPELGLHPLAIELLAAMIKQAATHTQLIIATQSPLLLDYFDPKDVLVADLVDGGTQLRRLDSADLAKWLEDYSLGQLWEKNEFGGRPVPA